MGWLYLLGRVLFVMIFIGSGIGHLLQLDIMSRYTAAKKLPAPKVLVLLTGLVMLAGGISVLLGVWMEIGTWLLFFFLVLSGFAMHNFWTIADPMQRMAEQATFMKNMSLAGAALIHYFFIQTYGYGPFTLGQPM